MLRHSPGSSGGRQSLTKWPALASSAARTASARLQFIDFDWASSSGNRGDQIGEVFHRFPSVRKDLAISVFHPFVCMSKHVFVIL